MDVLEVARWQFGIITVYHFLFVPLTIGLSLLVAGLQTAWYRTGKEKYLRLTKFYGKLFLINFAMGVVTGIVQEFQFGMNWSAYSRFVGDVFGAPLAIEGLLAFFLESTFLGLWIFGWNKLPKLTHLLCIWIAGIGTVLSSFFILAANSWMQHPVGFELNEETGRAELTDFWAVLFNSTNLITVPHTITAAFLTSGAFIAGIAMWRFMRADESEREIWRTAARYGSWVTIVAMVGVVITGDIQGKIMTDQQPMKMAAAEAQYENESSASFSLFTIGSLDGRHELWSVRVPYVLSYLAEGDPTAEVEGINDIEREYVEKYGPGVYTPVIPVTYWSFRLMMGFGFLAAACALWILWALRKNRSPHSKLLMYAALAMPLAPLAANSFGWIFTEMGRQPWVVFGTMRTSAGVSTSVDTAQALTSLITLTVLYGVLAVVEVWLLVKFAKKLPEADDGKEQEEEETTAPDLVY